MSVATLHDLFEHELKDIYFAEQKLVEALGELAAESTHRDVQQAFARHQKETQNHVKRLERVFKKFGESPEAETCQGIEGLLREKKAFGREKPSAAILDYFNLGAGAKTERYEITAYESLIAMAQHLGLADAAELLQQNLQEEEAALQKLQDLAAAYDVTPLLPEAPAPAK